MTDILDVLYSGEFHPSENSPKTIEYQRQRRLCKEAHNLFCAQLSDSQKALFSDFLECSGMQGYLESQKSFADGFCLGVQLVFEAFARPLE